MHILELQKNSKHMNTLERYYIYKEAYLNNHLNDQHTIIQNKIFEIISSNEKFLERFHFPCVHALFQKLHLSPPYPVLPLPPVPFLIPPTWLYKKTRSLRKSQYLLKTHINTAPASRPYAS
jgi:hypothetical protein